MKKAIKAFLPVAEAIQRLLHPYAEVVIHDIKKNQIAAIFNPFSKRRVGDSSLLSKEDELNMLEKCIGPYEKINLDGRKLKSVSSMIHDENGIAIGMLCINLDISKFEKFHAVLAEFIETTKGAQEIEPLFKDDWQERINLSVHHYLSQYHLTVETLKRSEKKNLIEHLYKQGAFTGKNSANYIATILNVSRATVYNYLSESVG